MMGVPVVAGPEKDGPIEIMSHTDKFVTFKAHNPYYFAIKALGDGATLRCHEGYNNVSMTANCSSQAYLVANLSKGKVPGVIAPQFFTCDHEHATAITIGYGNGAAISVVTTTI